MQVSDLLINQYGVCRMKDLRHYTSLAEMFRYPSGDLRKHTGEWRSIILKYDPGLACCLDPFLNHIRNESIEHQQEYFVSTFYVQPLCCLDIGYVLFGEDYRRGHFMANLKMEHRLAGNDCGTELPDHLPALLTLIPKLQDKEFAEELIFSLIVPALYEMIAGFRTDDNHYKGLLRLVLKIMETDFPDSKFERFRIKKTINEKKKADTMPG